MHASKAPHASTSGQDLVQQGAESLLDDDLVANISPVDSGLSDCPPSFHQGPSRIDKQHTGRVARSRVESGLETGTDLSNQSSDASLVMTNVDPFANLLPQEGGTMQRPPTVSSAKRRLTKQESVDSKLQDELSKFTASLSMRDSENLPMSVRKLQKHVC